VSRAINQRDVGGEDLRVVRDVGGDREWLDQRGLVVANAVGQKVNVANGHADEFAKSAIAMNAEHLQLGADIGPADRAGIAAAAANHGIDHHAGAHARRDAVADGIDPAEELVSDDTRIAREWVAAVQDVNVGAANAGALHADANFACRWFGQVCVPKT
jgi:hypothetical protein